MVNASFPLCKTSPLHSSVNSQESLSGSRPDSYSIFKQISRSVSLRLNSAAVDIAITTASIPFIILLILIIVSHLWNMFCFSSASLYNTVVKTNVQSRKNLSKFRHLFYAVLSLWYFINIIILKIPEAGTSSCFLCRIAEQTKPATSKMIQFEVQLMHGSDG